MSRSVLCVVSIYLFLNICFHETESSKSCSIFTSKPPYKAYSPINIITKDAIRTNVSTPLHLKTGVFGPLLVVNTGYAFEAYGNPAIISGGIVSGGILCKSMYRFHVLRAYFSKDLNGRSYNMINGKGSPLTMAVHYYDAKYGSFSEGLKHPGGVVVVNYMITYFQDDTKSNPFFLVPQIALLLIFHFPGIALYIGPEILLYLWFNHLVYIIEEYFVFFGSYWDPATGTEYPNVIQIQTAGIYPLLSKSQLSAFQSLLSKNFTRLETVAPLHKSVQHVYLGQGFTETYRLF